MYYMHGFGGGGWMAPLWLALLAGLVGLVVAAVIRNTRTRDLPDSAMRILKERYARGEISREEFDQKAGDIRGR